ncbi:MAG: outer membrane beta-barrel protein [Bacteroidales bacterium]|nr:outer membrane beta-barrel protein [Bacteroidales bacterium]
MRKSVIILAALLVSALAVRGQEIPKHEFQLEGFGGVSSFRFNTQGASNDTGFGGGGGFLYTVHFHPRWGFTTGLEASFHQASLQYSYDYGALSGKWDSDSNLFVSYLMGLGEKQRYTQLRIPLMVQYMSPLGAGGHHFYLAAGGKLGFKLAGSYSQNALTYHHTYQPIVHEYDFTLPWSEEAEGMDDPLVFYQQVGGLAPAEESGSYSTRGRFGKLFDFLASIELGVRWRLKAALALYTGIFIDAGLVSQADGGSPLVTADGTGASVLSSCAAPTPSVKITDSNGSKRVEATIPSYSENLTSRPKTIGFGLKARLAFGRGSVQRRGVEEELPAPDTTAVAPVVIIDTIKAGPVVITDTVKAGPVVVVDTIRATNTFVRVIRDTVTIVKEVEVPAN